MATALVYDYLAPSQLLSDETGSRLALATSGGLTPAGEVRHPFFFAGFMEYPAVVASALLVLARVARTRFYVPPNMLAAILRAADPVVTSTPEGLRFESFSVCCGVYARLDVDAEALDASHVAAGVTNVDVNPPLRQALAGLRAHEPLRFNVGDDQLRVSTMDGEVVEDKVPLSTRWLKGFAETQMLAGGMRQWYELDAAQTRQFVQGLPKNSTTKTVMWATSATRGLRLASRPSTGAVCVAGPERLRVVEPLLRYATGVRGYGAEADSGSMPLASMWVLELPGGRMTIGLSPEKARGFSGEGAVLQSLAGADVSDDADLVSALLSFEPRINVDELARNANLSQGRVMGALSLLASSGQVGYDLVRQAYFHRPLPIQADALETLHPRLADAQKLVTAGAVTVLDDWIRVRSGDIDYEVRLEDDPADDVCTCPWWVKYKGTRGPCKHVLAARIAAGKVRV